MELREWILLKDEKEESGNRARDKGDTTENQTKNEGSSQGQSRDSQTSGEDRKIKKLELPLFNGEDPYGWAFRVEKSVCRRGEGGSGGGVHGGAYRPLLPADQVKPWNEIEDEGEGSPRTRGRGRGGRGRGRVRGGGRGRGWGRGHGRGRNPRSATAA
ncbi:nucleolin 1-like [Pistacia vera]|uniref:nucleolin 1-like n=1 Tax=Pistacia vera TaxID=55513 RepID=UPI0012639AEF|nr:nucleolin 1-like [Pistacia vera]